MYGGRWLVQSAPSGQVHFTIERAGGPSRRNTLIALRVLDRFGSLPRASSLEASIGSAGKWRARVSALSAELFSQERKDAL